MDYSDKTILITGAASGIGAAIALELAKFNNRIIVTARREALLKNIAEKIQIAGSKAMILPGDATMESHGREVVEQIVRIFRDIDIAILNVGIGPPSNTLTASPEKIKFCLEANYYSLIHFFCPPYLPYETTIQALYDRPYEFPGHLVRHPHAGGLYGGQGSSEDLYGYGSGKG